MKLFSFCSSTWAQRLRTWKHRPGRARLLLHLQPPQQFHHQNSRPACDLSWTPTQPPAGALQAQFHSHCPAPRAAPPEVTRVFQPGHASSGHLLPAVRNQRVPLQGPNGKQECGPAGAERWGFKVHLFLDFVFWNSPFRCRVSCLFSLSLDSADATQRHSFLGFASFLAQLGPHPFIPELLGVVSLRAPLVTVVEEMENRDLLSFLWRCREVAP